MNVHQGYQEFTLYRSLKKMKKILPLVVPLEKMLHLAEANKISIVIHYWVLSSHESRFSTEFFVLYSTKN